MNKKYMISFVDKEYPPRHSFVDGFLCSEIFKKKNITNLLIVNSNTKIPPSKYLNVICFSIFSGRKYLKRITNFFTAFIFLKKVIKKKKIKIIFIRNDIMILISSIFFKNKVKIIFQQSFPFENDRSINFFKRFIYKTLLKIFLKYVYKVIVISELSKKRLSYTKVENNKFIIIPLLNSYFGQNKIYKLPNKNEKLNFVYIGSLSKLRNTEFWLDCFNSASKKCNFKITIFSTDENEKEKVQELDCYKRLKQNNMINIFDKIDRDILNLKLPSFDVGISLIPPSQIYLESAPTKLTEYMYAGLALLANNEIIFQKNIISNSFSGELCNWNKVDITNKIIYLTNLDYKIFKNYKINSYKYCIDNLSYEKYINSFVDILKV